MDEMTWGPSPSSVTQTFVSPGSREKEKGNVLFNEGKFEAALTSYQNGLEALQRDVTRGGIEERAAPQHWSGAVETALRLALHLNIAAALLILERPHEALASCTDALALDARSLKALQRRAKAQIGMGNMHAGDIMFIFTPPPTHTHTHMRIHTHRHTHTRTNTHVLYTYTHTNTRITVCLLTM